MAQNSRAAASSGKRRHAAGSTRPTAPEVPAPTAAQRAAVRTAIEPAVAAAGYDLEDFVVARVGRRYLVRVIVDGDAGVSLDGVADVSRGVSDAIDALEAAGGGFGKVSYTLEVSSPGVDRPLTEPRHWRRNIGRLVKVTVRHQAPLTARIAEVGEAGVVLDAEGVRHELPYDQLGPGRVQVEFGGADAEAEAEAEDAGHWGVDDEEGEEEEA